MFMEFLAANAYTLLNVYLVGIVAYIMIGYLLIGLSDELNTKKDGPEIILGSLTWFLQVVTLIGILIGGIWEYFRGEK